MAQLPQRVQYLLAELGKEFHGLQRSLETSHERRGSKDSSNSECTVTSFPGAAPQQSPPFSKDEQTNPALAKVTGKGKGMTPGSKPSTSSEAAPMTMFAVLPGAVSSDEAPSSPLPLTHIISPMPGGAPPDLQVQQPQEPATDWRPAASSGSMVSGLSQLSVNAKPGDESPEAGTKPKRSKHMDKLLMVDRASHQLPANPSKASKMSTSTLRSSIGVLVAKAHKPTLEESINEWRMQRTGTTKAFEPKRLTMRAVLIMFVDIVPPIVIVLNAATIGLSADIAPTSDVWTIFENVWISVYIMEFVIKLFLHGFSMYFCGSERNWNLFDCACLSVSIFDVAVTYIFSNMPASGGFLGLMKMLRLLRLLRLVRALHFPIFNELKQMIIGVVAGMRVLIWAVVLLFVIVFFIGVMVNNLMGEDEIELKSLPMSMLTVFRCYTDGCSANDGTSLASRLFDTYGAAFFFGYILSFMFVNLGIFNLIMALFIDNIVNRSLKKKLSDIGNSMGVTKVNIEETLLMLITEDDDFEMDDNADEQVWQGLNSRSTNASRRSSSSRSKRGSKESTKSGMAFGTKGFDAKAMFRDLVAREYSVSRDLFEEWLTHPQMTAMFGMADIDVANHADLFDALDVSLCEELDLQRLVTGLLALRGPITKSDIVAVRLKTCHLVDMVEEIKESLELVMTKMVGHG